MTDEFLTAIITVWLAVTSVLSAMFMFGGSLDADVIRACESRGYWQMGQTRIICSVEKKL